MELSEPQKLSLDGYSNAMRTIATWILVSMGEPQRLRSERQSQTLTDKLKKNRVEVSDLGQ